MKSLLRIVKLFGIAIGVLIVLTALLIGINHFFGDQASYETSDVLANIFQIFWAILVITLIVKGLQTAFSFIKKRIWHG